MIGIIRYYNSSEGLTLVELLVGMAIALVVAGAISGVFIAQNRIYVPEQRAVAAQQSLRAALDIMARDIRMAGYDPMGTGQFGISDISFLAVNGTKEVDGYSSITLSYDWDEDGIKDSDETITYSVYDSGNDGRLDLAREVGGGGRQLLAEDIAGFALAFAIDNDRDGELDQQNGGTIWAIDSDNDGLIDTNIDTNGDGLVTTADNATGTALPGGATVPLSAIRGVRIWVLKDVASGGVNATNPVYVVGDTRITAQAGHIYRLFSTMIRCRNLGL